MPKAGDEELGKYFKRIRKGLTSASGEGLTLEEFADMIVLKKGGKMDPAHLGRIEKGKRMPGLDVMASIYKFAVRLKMNRKHLIYLWLEANGLGDYVFDLKQPSIKDD